MAELSGGDDGAAPVAARSIAAPDAPDASPAQGDRLETPMTTAMLKALAHPLRRRIMRVFPRRQFVRAADLAGELEEPANKISFHLRTLAEAGLIEEAPAQARDRRDRVWTPVKRALNLGDPEHPVADETLGTAVMIGLVEEHQDMMRRLVAWAPEFLTGRETAAHGLFSRSSVRLTEEEFLALAKELQRLITKAGAAPDRDAEGVRVWQIDVIAADDTI